jgi:hypothetical protein
MARRQEPARTSGRGARQCPRGSRGPLLDEGAGVGEEQLKQLVKKHGVSAEKMRRTRGRRRRITKPSWCSVPRPTIGARHSTSQNSRWSTTARARCRASSILSPVFGVRR